MSTFTRRLRSRSLRKIIAILMIISIAALIVPEPTAAAVLRITHETIRERGSEIWTWLVSSLGVLGDMTALENNRTRKGVRPAQPLTKTEREAKVSTIKLNVAGEINLKSQQRVLLSAIPIDAEGNTIQGLVANWESSQKNIVFVRPNGAAVAGKPGVAVLTAGAGNKHATVKVTVAEGTKEPFGGKKRIDSKRDSNQETAGFIRSPIGTSVAQHWSSRKKRAHAINKLAMLPSALPFIRDPNVDPLPDNETSSLYQPNNLIGNPPGKKKPGALSAASAVPVTESGNKNFTFGLPVVSLPGRGVDVSLALIYNSLLWNKSTNPSNGSPWMTYDVDSGYPAQGFRLGYGQLEDQGSAGFTLTDADGTRHALVQSSASNYDTTDGTFIHFTGGSGWGTVFYPDGTRVGYGASGNGFRSYPVSVEDRNGNYILISYVNGVGPRISTIQDTLGRYVRFYYDSNNDLVTITRPGLTGQSDLQVMRFYYEALSLPSGLFASGINVAKPSTARVIRYVYLPTSGEGSSSSSGDIGYRFDYSQYGMIYQVVKFHGITASTTSTTSTGTVTEGTNTIAATTTYDYPISATSLSNVPTFAHRTDDWAGRTSGGSAPQYTFSLSEGSTETTSTVSAPDNTVMVTVAIKNSGAWNDGLITEQRIQNAAPTPLVFAKTVTAWEQNPTNGTPRIASIKFTNEVNKTTAIVLTYDPTTLYNNVSVVSERGFTSDGSLGTELRRTEKTYVTSSNYLNRRLLHLPATVKVFPGGSSTPASRIDYAYDNYGTNHANLTRRDDIIMHNVASDPFQEWEEICDWECMQWGYPDPESPFQCIDWQWVCQGYNPYDAATDYRGNVTSVTTYPDATSTSGTITHATTYDIAGNVISAQVDCCQSQSFTYSSANDDYAYPVSVTKGNPSGLHLTMSTAYDMNTGLVASATDPNNRVTNFAYNTDSLRLDHVDYPDGGQVSYDYGNALAADNAGRYHSNLVTSVKLDASRYLDSKSYFDGRGALTQTFDSHTSGNGWSIVDVEYDSMGRAHRTSNPYYCTSDYGSCSINPLDIWATRAFDHLGRITQMTSPRGDDANPSAITTVQTTYAGEVATFSDQAGKQRRQVTDALGRVVRLDEPTASGLGSESTPNQKTEYTYDVLNNLVKVVQGSQERYFKYDSLSRLIRGKQAEQTPNSVYNLTDSVNTSGTWTHKIVYNSHGLVENASDARGVSATFSYDALNRLTLIDYSDSTPDARYFYDSQTLPGGAPSYDHGFTNGRLIAMTYGSDTSTAGTYFGYDSMGRVKEQRQVTGSNTYSLSYTYNLAGLVATETYPSGRVLTQSYDNAGRVSQLSDGTTAFASSFSYAPSGAILSETWGNGAVQSIAYNNALQVSQIKLKQSSSGAELQRFEYLYGEVTQVNGNVDKSKNNGQIGRIDGTINGASTKEWEQRFSYDELGRISIASEYAQGTGGTPSWKQEFTYDRYGNRFQSGSGNTGVGFTPVVSSDISASTNRFISTGSTPITYDAAGNITQDKQFRIDPQGDGMNYTYDANGRQLTAASTDGTGTQTSVYDCVGQRVQTSANNVTRQMVYDIFGQLVADYKNGSLERENIYRGGQILAVYEAASTCYKSIDQFITDFYQGALGRQPNSTELTNWTTTLTQAQARGVRPLIGAAQELGNALFTSTEYTNMNTTDTQFVTDLYEAFLQRTPDTPGLNFWVSQVPSNGRTNVRLAFAVSAEFGENLAALCPGTSSGTSTSANLKYLLTDAQGSVRALMNNSGSGSSTIVARHDYLPFGETIWAGVGLRTTTQKYATTNGARHRFAQTEQDEATGLDHTWYRKYDSFAGRWTSPDPLSGNVANPQSFNLYTYAGNDPVNLIDASGLRPCVPGTIDASCDSSGFGGWGWGDISGGNRNFRPGLLTILLRERSYDWRILSRFLESLPWRWGSEFIATPFFGYNPNEQNPNVNPNDCPPTGEQLAKDPKVVAAMQQAWRESNPGMRDGLRREQGGWIYALNGKTEIRRARSGGTDSINLLNPPVIRDKKGRIGMLIGFFHTHPGFRTQEYSQMIGSGDEMRAIERGVPGLIMSEGMVIEAYGPTRRGSFPSLAKPPTDPSIAGFPGNSADSRRCP